MVTTTSGVDEKGAKYFDIEVKPEKLMESISFQSVVSYQSRNEKLECKMDSVCFKPSEIVNALVFAYKDRIICKLFSQIEVLKNTNVGAKITT